MRLTLIFSSCMIISYAQSPCTAEDRNTLTCIAPAVAGDVILSYRLILDDAPFPDEPDAELELMLRPNPTGFRLITESIAIGSTKLIQIEVRPYTKVIAWVNYRLRSRVDSYR